MSWYVDSWAVRDGMAFASERESDAVNANVTAFMGPPDFRPVPVAKLSTAMGAARRHFQFGLRTQEGTEIAFASLGEIVEMVRRAYVGGGAGLAPPGGGPPDVPAPPAGEDDGEGPSGESWGHLRQAVLEARSERPSAIERALVDLEAPSRSARPLVRRCVEESLMIMVRTELNAGALADLNTWHELMVRAGVWSRPAELHRFWEWLLKSAGARVPEELLPASWRGVPWWPAWPADDAGLGRLILGGLLFRVPCPLRSRGGRGFELATLGDHLASAFANRTYWDAIQDPEQAAPLFCCALAVASASPSRPGARMDDAWRGAWMRASQWIAENVLTWLGPDAEHVLDEARLQHS